MDINATQIVQATGAVFYLVRLLLYMIKQKRPEKPWSKWQFSGRLQVSSLTLSVSVRIQRS
jgi:uncharacterized membrane protein